MTSLIELANKFDGKHAETVAPLMEAIYTCTSIEELEALLRYIGNWEFFDEIIGIIHARLAQLRGKGISILEPEPEPEPEPLRKNPIPADDSPSPF